MLTYLKGDMFSSPAQVLVNAVNTVGVMGKGIALEFKKRYPDMFRAYQKACDSRTLDVGSLLLWRGRDKWVLLFPTKKHWRNPSELSYIEDGLKKFAANYDRFGITSIAFPRLGCGNGALDWNDVRPLMEKYLKPLPIRVYIYVGNYADTLPEHENAGEFELWLRREPQLIGFEALKRDLLEAVERDDTLAWADGKIKRIRWENGVITVANGSEIAIPEEELCSFWEYLRNVGVVQESGIPEQFAPYSDILLLLLSKLRYLQPVIISKNGVDFQTGSNGYQYVEDRSGGV